MKFLSIKEAVLNYKTSRATITRFAKKHQQTKNVKKENGKYFILDSFLDTHFLKMTTQNTQILKMSNSQNQSSKTEKNGDLENEKIKSELVTILKSENEFLKNEIGNKQKTIDTLLERQFEQNTIIQTLQGRIDGIGNKIDNSVMLLSEKVKENKNVPSGLEKQNDNGFTIASAIMILLLVLAIVVFLTVK